MIEQIIVVFHVLVALAIVGLILLQQGKGADAGASFGGGGSQTIFGPSGGGNALTQATAILAAVFFATSFGLAIIAKQKAALPVDDLMSGLEAQEQVMVEQPAVDAAVEIQESFDDLPDFDAIAPAGNDVVDSIPE
ncbi:MAG: preprotein translocase subunit SecG [Pseudomonadales bacterium]|nr:preprotein translocase subunit SecG [Pseudomonadales bacterium]MDB2410095.1 preprotein translocase subunit SecG [Pseudomonadales bacterium]MDG1938379.1 preprotein translocase subunit SecG [Pseudomonadales bacterium]MDG2035444.1 preprotein translocase subunit SecG [Pseudomonadales bacterium]